MKLLRFGDRGRERPGILDSNGVLRDLSGEIDDLAGDTLSRQSLARIAKLDLSQLPAVGDARIGPCVGRVGKFICIGMNYADHAVETCTRLPEEPEVLMKAISTITGPNDPLLKPRNSTKMDWEVELGVVIGRHVRDVSEAEAADCIAGYCVVHDVCERKSKLERGDQWIKDYDSFGPIGPWLVTPDEVPNPLNLKIWLKVNGRTYQSSSTRHMVFSPTFLVHYLSQSMNLHPGDVISTGTPPGVGLEQRPPTYLQLGDEVELGVEGLGVQKQQVACD